MVTNTEAGAPAGVINVVTGPGAVVGAELAASAKVDKVAFTGSTAVGKTIMQAASGNLKKISLELGGKSPNVVFADADLRHAVPGSLRAFVMNAGQVCLAGTRVVVERTIHDQLVAAIDLIESLGGGYHNPDLEQRPKQNRS